MRDRGLRIPGVRSMRAASGSGKEHVAEELHAASGRSGPFVPVNCAAIPQALAEAELFWHEAGAFTGAAKQSEGLFRAANGGTLFLDEIGERRRSTRRWA
jgi:DNA-binding NtrC family response regulator